MPCPICRAYWVGSLLRKGTQCCVTICVDKFKQCWHHVNSLSYKPHSDSSDASRSESSVCLQNPYRPSQPGLGLGKKPDYPKELQQRFCEGPARGYAWIPPKNPALLDFEHAEFVLIGRGPGIGSSSPALCFATWNR